ncbi:hypothetical protein AURDEDRAFT_160929 [Auricularia subglabra TFB-10046 SS5]|nr:hypothetical protein AURDEDRAFT_160929 [Auricularia subglabra TFB-10046 SS5]
MNPSTGSESAALEDEVSMEHVGTWSLSANADGGNTELAAVPPITPRFLVANGGNASRTWRLEGKGDFILSLIALIKKLSDNALLAAAYVIFLFCVAMTLLAELAVTVAVRKNPDRSPATYGRLSIHLAIFLCYTCILTGTTLLTLSLVFTMPTAIFAIGCVGLLSSIIVVVLSVWSLKGDILRPLVELYQWVRDGQALEGRKLQERMANTYEAARLPPSFTPTEKEFRTLLDYYRRYRQALRMIETHDENFRWASSPHLRAKRLAHAAQALKADSMTSLAERTTQSQHFLHQSMFRWVPILDQLTANEQASRRFWRQPPSVQINRASLLLFALTATDDDVPFTVHDQNAAIIEAQNAAVEVSQKDNGGEAMVSITMIPEELTP